MSSIHVRAALAALTLTCGMALSAHAQTAHRADPWIGSWAASQQLPEPNNLLPAQTLDHAVLRQIVHLSLGGRQLKVSLSNEFGTQPLHLAAVHLARPLSAAGAAIDPASDRAVTFAGQPDVIIPAGALYVSDAVDFPVQPQADLAVSIQFIDPPAQQTGHPGSHATSYVAHDVQPSAANLPAAQKIEHWYTLAAISVATPEPNAAAVITFGDSITDGHASTTNGNDRWPDLLAARLAASPATRHLGVLNEGIGGNHLLTDGLGPNALARLDRDVLAQPGARFVIVLEGINDLGGATREHEISAQAHDALVARLLAAYQQIVERAHARGLTVFGATITPDAGSDYYHPGPVSEADRQQMNTWIRTPGHFDGVIDFDKAVADPAHPDHLLPALDCGDHLHPSPAGYKAMANAIPLTLFTAPAP